MITKRLVAVALVVVGVAFARGCGETALAYGDANSLIAVVDLDHWDAVSDEVYAAFETTITTVRDEKKFTVTYQEPYGEHWMNLRRFRHMVIIGSRADTWVQEVIDESRRPVTGDGLHQVYDVWSAGQTVNLIILPESWTPADLRPHLAELSAMLEDQYRSYARNRMYMSGVDSALADTLATEHGFEMWFPSVYRWRRVDSVFVFRNDNPDPSELIREVVVSWKSPAPASVDFEELLEWRAALVAEHYSEPQDVFLGSALQSEMDDQGSEVVQIQAQWRNPPERGWPAGGPFITRAITCDTQDRTYFVDAWLYAPGKEKYEYMIQLETLLDSFRCGT